MKKLPALSNKERQRRYYAKHRNSAVFKQKLKTKNQLRRLKIEADNAKYSVVKRQTKERTNAGELKRRSN